MKKNFILVILFLIFLIGGFIRFYKLSNYPVNLSHDEVSQFYDAISILKTGRDIHGQKLPFVFRSIGDFKPPFYTYATIPFIYLFGEGEVVIRIVGVLFGILLIPAVYFFTNKLFSNKSISLTAAFFTAVAPFEIHYSRKSFEGQAGVFILLVGFTLLLGYLRGKRDVKKFIMGSGILGLSLYIYFSYTILIPIFYLGFLLILFAGKIPIPRNGILVFLIITIPLLVFIIKDPNSANRVKSVSLMQDSSLTEMIKTKADNNPIKRILITLRYATVRYLDQFNPTFLFINGLDLTNQDPFDVGPFYLFQLPLIILGSLYLFKKFGKKKEILTFLLFIIILGLLPSGLSFEKHSPHRILIVLTMLNIVSAIGAYFLTKVIFAKVKKTSVRIVSAILLLVFIIWNFAYFAFTYMVSYPIDKSEFSQYPYKLVAQIAKEYYNDYDQIIFDPRFGKDMPWIGAAADYYLAFYGNYPVEKIQKEYKVTEEVNSQITFGKYTIRDIYWPEDRKLRNTLIIVSPWVISKETFGNAKLVAEIKSYQGTTTAFYTLSLK